MSAEDTPRQGHVSEALRQGLAAIVVAALAAGIVAGVVASLRPATWSASTYVLVNTDPSSSTGTVDDRTMASEASFALSDTVVEAAADAGPAAVYTVETSPSTDGLTFTSSARSAEEAVEASRTAAATYVSVRQDELNRQLNRRVSTAQGDVDQIQSQIESLGTNESTEAQRAALSSQLATALGQLQETRLQLSAAPRVATVLNEAEGASRNGPPVVLVALLGAVVGAVVTILVLVVRDQVSPRIRRGDLPRGTEAVFTIGAAPGGGRHGKRDGGVELGAAAVSLRTAAPAPLVAVVGPADESVLRAVGEQISRHLAGSTRPVRHVEVLSDVDDRDGLVSEVAAARGASEPAVVVASRLVDTETVGQLAEAGDRALIVVQADVTKRADAEAFAAPLRASAAEVAWLVVSRR